MKTQEGNSETSKKKSTQFHELIWFHRLHSLDIFIAFANLTFLYAEDIGYFLCARQHAAVVLVCRWGSVGFGVNEDSPNGPDESWRVSRHYCVSGGCSKKGTTQKTYTKDS